MKRENLMGLCDAMRGRRPVVLATDLATGDESCIDADGVQGDLDLTGAALDAARAALDSGQSVVLDTGEEGLFLHAFAPLPRLVVVGAVHIAQVLAPMARLAGFDVTVIDPRGAFATKERFPGVEIVAGWPDEVLERQPLDAATAVVTLAHDGKIDDLALLAALRSEAFYVGALGSRKTHAKRLARLADAGLPEGALARIHAPVGLDLGGREAAEIAVAILAEVVQARNGGAP
jgi:xanthine dehydrogenase accessory factor